MLIIEHLLVVLLLLGHSVFFKGARGHIALAFPILVIAIHRFAFEVLLCF